MRLKSEHNLELLAGNGGDKGRLLLENKVTGTVHDYQQKIDEDIEVSGTDALFIASRTVLTENQSSCDREFAGRSISMATFCK